MSESSSHLQLQTVPLTSDHSIQPESALCVESQCRDDVKVEADDSIDCDDGISAHPGWFQARDETDLFRDTTALTAHTDDFDISVIDDDVLRDQHYDVDVGLAEEWLQQQLSETPNCDDLKTYHQHQQPHQQRSGAALTLEELKLFSGAVPSPLTYKGRRLRHIAPKPTTSIIADAAVTHQTTQYHHSLPNTMFSVVIGGPVTTTNTSTFSRTAAQPDRVDEKPSPTGKTDFTCPVFALKLNLAPPHTRNNVLFYIINDNLKKK